ncbi:hypothetical protein [Alicyclobacillus contaminans]|uniref:hypothetical protein n=1 Tax=Alicyclobacillus contaminans TaxID=392016 RepID=UPI00041538C5|nr:hypothetical protein [Alicyclobacillus contaminans]
MPVTHRLLHRFLGQHVACHTHFGTFRGVIVHCSKRYIILGVAHRDDPVSPWTADAIPEPHRPWFGGPPGPAGPGYPPGTGPGGNWGGGWGLAIPLAAILGITAIGMHWW